MLGTAAGLAADVDPTLESLTAGTLVRAGALAAPGDVPSAVAAVAGAVVAAAAEAAPGVADAVEPPLLQPPANRHSAAASPTAVDDLFMAVPSWSVAGALVLAARVTISEQSSRNVWVMGGLE